MTDNPCDASSLGNNIPAMRRRRASNSDDESPHAKRARLDLSYADEEDEDRIEPAPPRAKRVRRLADAPVQEEEESNFEDAEDEITPVPSRETRGGSRGSGAAVVASDDEEQQEYADDDEEEDEEDVQEQMRFSTEKGFAHSGILHSVRLDRFMSHGCFRYDLGPNMNIINGKNGSGKSAIVAALQIGLNGSVGITERAKKLEDLIKHGEDSAIITIKILNRKPPPTDNGFSEPDLTYKHDMYGDIITIERRIGRENRGNSFAVKNRNRHVQLPKGTSPKQEVQNICDHFGFMVDNPVAILTQTKSKEFLSKGKPEDHFKLFRRATLLGPLQDELVRTKTITKDVENILKWNLENAPKAEEELRKKEHAHQQAQEMKNIHEIIRQAEASFAWTLVQEEENKLNIYETKTADEFEPAAEKTRMVFEKSQLRLEDLKSEQSAHNNVLTEATERSRVLSLSLRESNKNAQRAKFDMERQGRRIQEFEAECGRYRRDIQKAKERMESAREKHFAGQEQKQRIVREIRQIESTVEELQEKIDSARKRESVLLADKLPLEDEVQRLSRDADALRHDFEGKRRQHMQIASLARNKDDLGRFGDGMSGICDRIKRSERLFHKPPIGPIGQFVNINDESWAATVETAIGFNSLRAFIVTDSHDAKVLESLLPRGGNRPTITIANIGRDRYAVGRRDMPDVSSLGHRTILETVEIQHNAVYNLLLDQSHIERHVLSANEEDVTQLGWSRIPNLKTVWNKRCDRAYSRNGSNVFRNGRRPIARVLTKDMRPYLQSLEDELDNLKREMDSHAVRVQDTKARLRSLNANVQNERREIDLCGRKVTDVNRMKARLEDQLNQAENAFDPTPFEQEISGYESQIRESEANRATATAEVTTLQEAYTSASEAQEEAKAAMRDANVATKEATRLLEVVQGQIARVKSRDRQLRKEYEHAQAVVNRAHEEIDQQRNRIAEVMVEARKSGDCPNNVDPASKPSADWQRTLTTQKQRLETEQERRGGRTAADIEMDYLRSKKKHDENVEYQKRVRFYVKKLKRGTNYREDLLIRLNKSLKKMVKANFRRFLSTRGHTGTITFGKSQNGTPTLRLSTEIATHERVDGERHRTEDLRTLSGGEKSYTTLCFILALAEICQTPVRVMDEIDVFQDEASRHASFTTITQFCTQYLTNRQIIIITPLALPNFTSNDSVRVVRLPDPVRQEGRGRQTRIDNYIEPSEE